MPLISIANAMARQEDKTWDSVHQSWNKIDPNSLAQKNLNPGNLSYDPKHPEYTPRAVGMGVGGRFARYKTVKDGMEDLKRQIQLDAKRGKTVREFINKFAPPKENETTTYVRNVCMWLGVSEDMKLADVILLG